MIFGPMVVALAGFLDAAYLTVEHFKNVIPPCSVGGCEQVLTSSYASIVGIPVALLGLIYYAVIVLACVTYVTNPNTRLLQVVAYLSIAGFAVSIWFVFAQVVLIHAICPYCLLSEALSTALFFFALRMLQLKGND